MFKHSRREKSGIVIISISVALLLGMTSGAFAAAKLGGTCANKGATSKVSGIAIKCSPSGNKLKWIATGKSGQPSNGAGKGTPTDKKSPPPTNQISPAFDPENPPQFITANFVDPSKVYTISKFRSGVGHDFSTQSGETCRSMKHYLGVMDANAPDYKILGGGNKDAMPLPVQGVDVPIFSPVDGVVSAIEDSGNVLFNRAIDVTPNSLPDVRIRLMHVTPLLSIKAGQTVKAGEQIALVLRNQPFDAGVEESVKDPINKTRYISIFKAMTDEVFSSWKARGAVSRDQFVLTKAQVDANPWQCATGPNEIPGAANFAVDYLATPEGFALNEVVLTGYAEVSQQIKAKYGQ